MLPGDKIDFEPVDHRVNKINAELFVVETPVLSVENYTITATCATEGATIFYYKKTLESNVLVYTEPFEAEEGVSYCFFAKNSGMLNSNFVDVDLN